jgi:hypothetical protein
MTPKGVFELVVIQECTTYVSYCLVKALSSTINLRGSGLRVVMLDASSQTPFMQRLLVYSPPLSVNKTQHFFWVSASHRSIIRLISSTAESLVLVMDTPPLLVASQMSEIICCRNSPLSPPRCLARGSDPLGASSPWDLAPESLSPTGQGLGTAAAPVMSATDPRLRERHLRCPQCCGSLKCRPKPRPPAFPQHWFQELCFFLQKQKIDEELFANFLFATSDPHPSGRSSSGAGAGKHVRFFCCVAR